MPRWSRCGDILGAFMTGRTLAKTEILLVTGLLVVVGASFAAERAFALAGPIRIGALASLVLAGVPGLLWLGYFYLQDRQEPEPKSYVVGVFLLGAFVAAPLAGFLGHHTPPTGAFTAETFLLAVVPVGLAQELSKYLVVRYSVY